MQGSVHTCEIPADLGMPLLHSPPGLPSWAPEVTVIGGLHLGCSRVPSALTYGSMGEERKEWWLLSQGSSID